MSSTALVQILGRADRHQSNEGSAIIEGALPLTIMYGVQHVAWRFCSVKRRFRLQKSDRPVLSAPRVVQYSSCEGHLLQAITSSFHFAAALSHEFPVWIPSGRAILRSLVGAAVYIHKRLRFKSSFFPLM